MKTHELYRFRKHLILDHGWDADRANAVGIDTVIGAHEDDHVEGDPGHTHKAIA